MSDTKFNAEYFNELKDRLIRATGSPGMTSFHEGKVHMTLGEWARLISYIEEDPTNFDYFVVPEYVLPEQVPSNAITMTLDEAKQRVDILLAGIGEQWKIVQRPALGAWEEMPSQQATDTTPGAPYYGRHPDGTLATEPPDLRVFVPLATLTYAANVLESSADNGDKYNARQIRDAIATARREQING